MNIHFSIFAYQNSILPLRFTWNTALSLCHSYHVLIFYSLVLFSILECVFWFPKEMIFDGMDQNRLWKIFKEIGIPDNLTCLLRNLYAGQEATVGSLYGTTDWFRLRKKCSKAVYCPLAYLTYMQSTSWEMLGWMNYKLESRLQGEISTTSNIPDGTILMAESKGELKNLFIRVKEESEKARLKLGMKKMKIMASGPITLWQGE